MTSNVTNSWITITIIFIFLTSSTTTSSSSSSYFSSSSSSSSQSPIDVRPEVCYVRQSSCTYRLTLQATDCSGDGGSGGQDVANDEPLKAKGGVREERDGGGRVGRGENEEGATSAAVKRIEHVELSLMRMIESLSSRSLRHIRQIKTDLKEMSKSLESLKEAKLLEGSSQEAGTAVGGRPRGKEMGAGGGRGGDETGGGGWRKSNRVQGCPQEFIGGGSWPVCYRLSGFNATWHEAKDYCLAIGANLLSLETIKEAYIVDYLIKSNTAYQEPKGWWTSGNYIARTHTWMWTSTKHLKPISFSRWAPGEPNARSTMHCLLLYRPDKYYWHDGTCTDKHAFICEITPQD